MTRHQLAVVILQALLNITEEKALHLATINHSEYYSLMKNPKKHLEYMHETALRVLAERKNKIITK